LESNRTKSSFNTDTIPEKYLERNVCKPEENAEFFAGFSKIISSHDDL